MKYLALFLLFAPMAMRFDITDARGKKASGVAVETGEADADGWRELRIVKGKPGIAIVWPYDARVRESDGPGAVPVMVAEAGDTNLRGNVRAAAAALLKGETASGFQTESSDPFAKGVAFLAAGKAVEAVEPLGQVLKERERQLTHVPSEIYAAAMLSGRALLGAGKYDDAAVAFLKAIRQRPSDEPARKYRAEALAKAGKPEAQ